MTGSDREGALRRILVASGACEQPPLAVLPAEELTVVLPALALGGAERIVTPAILKVR